MNPTRLITFGITLLFGLSLGFVSCKKDDEDPNDPNDPNNNPIKFEAIAGGSDEDHFQKVILLANGNFLAVGATKSYGAGGLDVYLAAFNAEGQELWSQTYGGTGDDEGQSVAVTNDGGFVLIGSTNSFGNGYDAYMIKTDADGNEQWSNTFGGTGTEVGMDVVQTIDGAYAFCGLTSSFGAGNNDMYLVKTDAFGNEDWYQTYGDADLDQLQALHEKSDGCFVLLGTHSPLPAVYDLQLKKVDEFGWEEWTQSWNGNGLTQGLALHVRDNGEILAGGLAPVNGGTDFDFYLVKTDVLGNEQWVQNYGNTEYESLYGIAEASDGYVLSGIRTNTTSSVQRGLTIKTNFSGIQQWEKEYGDHTGLNDVVMAGTGILAAGSKRQTTGGNINDGFLIRADSEGETQ